MCTFVYTQEHDYFQIMKVKSRRSKVKGIKSAKYSLASLRQTLRLCVKQKKLQTHENNP